MIEQTHWNKSGNLPGRCFAHRLPHRGVATENDSPLETSTSAFSRAHDPASTEAVAQRAPVDLGTLGGTLSAPRALNDIGEVVGESTIGPGTARHAFLWTATGGIVDLGTLGGANSVANDVNAFGQVVGVSQTTMAPHAFLWTATGGMLDLGTLGGSYSEAAAVNDHGQVVDRATPPRVVTRSSGPRPAGWLASARWVAGAVRPLR